MIDHVTIGVRDLARSKAFYDAVFQPLGYKSLHTADEAIGYGSDSTQFWIVVAENPVTPDMKSGLHFGFTAPTHESVADFYRKGLASGGKDNGKPGLRPEYGPNYYAAFVIDPDGYR